MSMVSQPSMSSDWVAWVVWVVWVVWLVRPVGRAIRVVASELVSSVWISGSQQASQLATQIQHKQERERPE